MKTPEKPNVVMLNGSLPRLSEIMRESIREAFPSDAENQSGLRAEMPNQTAGELHLLTETGLTKTAATEPGVTEPGLAADSSRTSAPVSQLASLSAADGERPAQIVQMLHTDDVAFGSFQTREATNLQDLEGLAASISSQGILQPVLVRAIASDDPREESFEIIAGERRLRAARLAGLTYIPALVRAWDDQDALEVAIIENAQRFDLNPIEEAKAYQRLLEQFRLTQKEIAQVVGKSRPSIANSLRLLQLPPEIIELLKSGELSAGHGRALLGVEEQRRQLQLARRALAGGWSVHALEKAIQRILEGGEESEEAAEDEEELKLRRQSEKIALALGLESVALKIDTQGRRRVSLVFETEAAWKRFYSRVRE